MNHYITTILCLILCLSAYSQSDNIILKTGEEINAKVIEIGFDDIKYKKIDYLDGPNYVLSQSQIFMIKFSNGDKSIFNNPDDIIKDKNDEKLIYSKLLDGTLVQLITAKSYSSKNLKVGSVIELRVKDAVKDNNSNILIKANQVVYANVNESTKAKGLGKAGSLGFILQDIKAVDGQRVPAYLSMQDEGKDRSGAAIGVGVLLFWPALFIKGKNAEIKAGTILTAIISEDKNIKIDPNTLANSNNISIPSSIDLIVPIKTLTNDCGEEPVKPPNFNNPQYKTSKKYKAYKKKLKEWNDCNNLN
tara:strand:+ start:1475 stop:2386 length:912 start_codon:yes stop_codon:yes gene_type:complete